MNKKLKTKSLSHEFMLDSSSFDFEVEFLMTEIKKKQQIVINEKKTNNNKKLF